MSAADGSLTTPRGAACAELERRHRTALAALLVAAAVDLAHWAHLMSFSVLAPRLTMILLTGSVFLLEAFSLAMADPRAARRLVTGCCLGPFLLRT
jgi:hypothetical protein